MQQLLLISVKNIKEAYRFTTLLISALLATMLFLPLAWVVPKKKGRCVVIGRERGSFSDNCKHFYLFLQKNTPPGFSVVFISSNRKTIDLLRTHSLPYLFYPTLQSLYRLLTAEFIIMDSAEWISSGKFQLTAGGKLIQLWHGAPLKEIERPLFLRRLQGLSFVLRLGLLAQKKIIGRYPEYFALVSTSHIFTQKVFSPAFTAKHFVESGYPRNDAIISAQKDFHRTSPLWLNCDFHALQLIDNARKKNKKIILYSPTFRKDLSSPFSENILSFNDLNKFAVTHGILFVIKLHPLMAKRTCEYNMSNIVNYTPECDIYPALSLFDTLITDYSSIYFDYLLLNRPIIFFPYDLQHYISDERKLFFNYKEMAPGIICKNQKKLQEALLLPDSKHWATRRSEVLNLVFDHVDNNAGARLAGFLIDFKRSNTHDSITTKCNP